MNWRTHEENSHAAQLRQSKLLKESVNHDDNNYGVRNFWRSGVCLRKFSNIWHFWISMMIWRPDSKAKCLQPCNYSSSKRWNNYWPGKEGAEEMSKIWLRGLLQLVRNLLEHCPSMFNGSTGAELQNLNYTPRWETFEPNQSKQWYLYSRSCLYGSKSC